MKNIHVVGAVIIHDGKILCAQRPESTTLPLMWEFPGGKIEQGESSKDALKREIHEEMSCDISVGAQLDHTVYEYDFGIVHLTTFYCYLNNDMPILQEHRAMKWLKPDDIQQLDWAPADIPAVEKLSKLSI